VHVETTFSDLRLLTAPGRVFTPRPATENLVDHALELADDRPLRVADVGTGTGAIAVAMAVKAPRLETWASDTSPDAVELARKNAELHGVSDRVHVVQGDLLDPLPGAFDLIVANLPYLPESLHDPRYDDEPHAAIYAPGDGLDHYRRLLSACEAGKLVTPGGAVVLQFHRKVLAANCWELKALRARLDELQLAA
jgi:release factor glutamine methyltransferase